MKKVNVKTDELTESKVLVEELHIESAEIRQDNETFSIVIMLKNGESFYIDSE